MVISLLALIGASAGYYSNWAPVVHDWFTPQFLVEVHRTWHDSMTTPFRSKKTGECGNDTVDELAFVEVKNNHRTRAIGRLISISEQDWAGWHTGTIIGALAPLVSFPESECRMAGTAGTGGKSCYIQLDNKRLDDELSQHPLAPNEAVSGYLLIKWDVWVNGAKTKRYGAVLVDDKQNRTELTHIDPPTASSHLNDLIDAEYTVKPLGWEPDCQKITADADR